MTHRRRTDSTQTVSLFPFLAVLLCTMGALLVLLVVMARQARLRAAVEDSEPSASSADEPASGRREPADTAAASPQDSAALAAELAELNLRAEQLSTMRSDAQERLKSAQLRLGNSEDHLRTLHDRVAAAYEEAEKLATLEETTLTSRREATDELARLKDLVLASETELESARDEAAKRPKSYAIVPYTGSHGTRRRPIYIECRKDAVVLLPESIRFTSDDFDEPVGPGNPLAAALRAVREYQTTKLADPTLQGVQPYPLLLIRPDGVAAYYRAREAIASWGPDFGYEMIDADWSLELPAADPNLARVVYQAVKSARARQQLLAQAAPRRFRRGSAAGGLHGGNDTGDGGGFYVPSDTLVAEGGRGAGDAGQGTGRGQGTGDAGQGSGDRGEGTGVRGQRTGDWGKEPGIGSDGTGSGGREQIGQGDPSGGARPGPQYSVLGRQSSGASGMGTGQTPPSPVGAAGTSGTDSDRYPPPTGDTAGRYGNDGHGPGDQGEGDPPSATHQPGAPGAPGQTRGAPGQPRAGDTAGSTNTSQAASRGSGSPGGLGGGAGGPENSGSGSAGPGGTEGSSAAAAAAVATFSASLGQPRGSGRTAARAVPIRRAIHVVVRNDRLSILPEQGVGGGRIVSVQGNIDTAAGDFAAALRDRVKRWGIAGHGLYWKPILVLKPAPDGIANANRLASRLRASGVEVQMPGSVARRVEP